MITEKKANQKKIKNLVIGFELKSRIFNRAHSLISSGRSDISKIITFSFILKCQIHLIKI